MARRFRIPNKYIRVDSGRGTVAIRGRFGRFRGRRTNGRGDSTGVRRLTRDVDFNHNGRIDSHEKGGIILGRSSTVRSSPRARGHVRRSL
jgi:hypothetical protein